MNTVKLYRHAPTGYVMRVTFDGRRWTGVVMEAGLAHSARTLADLSAWMGRELGGR